MSVKSIQGKYRWYERYKLARLKKLVESGGSEQSKLQNINEFSRDRFLEARRARKIVRGWMIRNWAIQGARCSGFEQVGKDDNSSNEEVVQICC